MDQQAGWQRVCALADIVPETGVCARINRRQIAIFRLRDDDRVYAIDQFDPNSGANVLARGIVGDVEGEWVVASPIYKQHFSLTTGRCLEAPQHSVNAWPTRVIDGDVWLWPEPKQCFLPQPADATEPKDLVVIGNGMAGMRVVEELLELAPDRYRITVFGAEPRGNYNRILLSPVLAGEKKAADIELNSPDWYADNGITLYAGDPVVAIDRTRRRVRAASGLEVPYDRILLATGSKPFMPPIEGIDKPGVTRFRDLDDVDAMIEASAGQGRAVVIGGGLLGLEAASGLAARGMQVDVVHLMDRLMERQLDHPAAAMLQQTLAERGITTHLQAQSQAITGDDRAQGVRLADGKELPADLVVVAAGIQPNIELARSAVLRCNRGVLVDDTLCTSDPRVYAVGECVEHRGATYGLVAPLWEQASVCARQLAECSGAGYKTSALGTQLKISGVELYSAGSVTPEPEDEDLVMRDARAGVYKRIVLNNDRITGVVLFGDTRDGNWYFEQMQAGTDISAMRSQLLFGPDYCVAA